MALSFHGSGQNESFSGATSQTVANVAVSVGDLVIVYTTHGAPLSTITCSDGTSNLIPLSLNLHTNGEVQSQFFYLLSSTVGGVASYTCTYGDLATNRSVLAFTFTYTGSPQLDDESIAEFTSTTNISSGGLDATTNDEVVIAGYTNWGAGLPSNEQINGVSPDAILDGGNSIASGWYRILTSPFTNGAATATVSASPCLLSAVSIKAGAGPDHITWGTVTQVTQGKKAVVIYSGMTPPNYQEPL